MLRGMAVWRLRALAVAAGAAMALLPGCGGSGGGGAAQATPTATATATAAEAPAQRPASRRPAGRGVRLARIGTFDQPLYVTAPPGDRRRIFVVEKGGRIMVVRGGRKLRRPFLDLRGRVTTGSEQGLLSMAFAPDYASSGRFYVYFTDTNGDTRVIEYRRRTED